MSYQKRSGSLPRLPSCNIADTTSNRGRHFLLKEQGKAIPKLYSSPASFELSNDDVSRCFSNSTTGEHSESISKDSGDRDSGVDAIVRGLRSSDRLFCEPACTSSIVEAAAGRRRPAPAPLMLFEGSVAVAVDSEDPYGDFRASMEEMVAAHGDADDWGWLEGMLEWYLRANGEGNHGIIVEAFVDLLLTLASSPLLFSSTSTSTSTSCDEQKKMTKKKMAQKKKKKKNGSSS